jgi:conjugal transfer/entry exclusion protein
MCENRVFDTSSQIGVVDQIEFVANGLKVVRLLTAHNNYVAKIQNEFPEFNNMLSALLKQYFENAVI